MRARVRVAVVSQITLSGASDPPQPPGQAPGGRPPRLTETAVIFGLEGAALDAELTAVREQRSRLAAYEAGSIKAILGAAHVLPLLPGARSDVRTDPAARSARDAGPAGERGPDPALQVAEDFLPDEVAVLLNTSVPSSRHLVEPALVLVRQLPQVWHALADGRIDETRARVMLRVLGWQAVSSAGPVADEVVAALADRGVAWAVAGCPPSTSRERLDAALIAADPSAADRRKELRKRGAEVTALGTGDGLAELRARQMDAADARLARAQIDAHAQRIKADGDPRPIGAIRLAVLTALTTRPWEEQDRATAHITINADLAELTHLPDLSASPGPSPVAGAPTGASGTSASRSAGDSSACTAADAQPADEAPDDSRGPVSTAGGPDAGGGATRGTGAGHVDSLPVSPTAVRALLQRIDALGLTDPENGHLSFMLTGDHGRVLSVATPAEVAAAATGGRASVHRGPSPATRRAQLSTATCAPATGTAASLVAVTSPASATPTTSSPTTTSDRRVAEPPASPTWPCCVGTTIASRPTREAGASGWSPTAPCTSPRPAGPPGPPDHSPPIRSSS